MTKRDEEANFAKEALEEAMASLQLVKLEALADLLALLRELEADPRALDNRSKQGTPLTTEQKATIGLSKRANMSEELLGQLTLKGLREPLTAHHRTLQRAMLSLFRWRDLRSAQDDEEPMMARRLCPETAGCSVSDTWTAAEAFGALPPAECRDCDYGTCRSVFIFRRRARIMKGETT